MWVQDPKGVFHCSPEWILGTVLPGEVDRLSILLQEETNIANYHHEEDAQLIHTFHQPEGPPGVTGQREPCWLASGSAKSEDLRHVGNSSRQRLGISKLEADLILLEGQRWYDRGSQHRPWSEVTCNDDTPYLLVGGQRFLGPAHVCLDLTTDFAIGIGRLEFDYD